MYKYLKDCMKSTFCSAWSWHICSISSQLLPNATWEMTSPEKLWSSGPTSNSHHPLEPAKFSHLLIRSLQQTENDGSILCELFIQIWVIKGLYIQITMSPCVWNGFKKNKWCPWVTFNFSIWKAGLTILLCLVHFSPW